MPNAENVNIRDVILQGVYEENLAMSAPHAKPARSGPHPGFRFITRILSVLLVTVAIVLIQFVADPINQQSTYEYGKLFESFIINEIYKYNKY